MAAAACLTAATAAFAQQDSGIGPRLLQDAAVKAALQAIRDDEAQTLADQIRLCEIPAPPFKEEARARAYADAFRAAGLKNVRLDGVGNVLGERPGVAARPNVVFSAHLDTVFPAETDVKVTREGAVLKGPGIGDDCRGLAVLLAIARALDKGKVQTPGTITFVGTVGEEGLGDLRGVKALFRETLKGQVDRFISVDGGGLIITHVSVGSLRYRVTFKGPGGHSYGDFGMANPIHALGRAIASIGEFKVPREPKTTFSVGRIGGGTSVNAIAFEAWMEVDLRSADRAALKTLDGGFHAAVDHALAAENARWGGRGQLTVDKQVVGDRPPGRMPADSAIVQAAVSVTRALGLPVTLEEGSTDANIPMSLDIPALTIEGGGSGSGAHSLAETYDSTDSWKGAQRALLLAIALAQPSM